MSNTGVNPYSVTSPQDQWRLIDVLYETDMWSMAIGRWYDSESDSWRPVLAQRWNGWMTPQGIYKGMPVSRGYPVWFVLPDETAELYFDSEFIPASKRAFVRQIFDEYNKEEEADDAAA